MLTNKLKSPCDAKNRYYFSSDPVDLKALSWWPLHFQTIFSNIWPLSVAVGQGYPDVNNNETNYDDEDSNSPCHNCNVLVTEWDKWQDITYLWRQLMMWSVGRLWFPGDHYLPHWPMKPGSAAINEFIAVFFFHKMLLATHDLCWSNIGPFRGRLSSGLVWMMLHTQ